MAWAYLIRAYALNANIAYTQIHGLPLRLGKYPPGSTSEDKSALLHALRCLGQDAAGIIPTGMEVIFQTPTTATQDIPGQLVTRCEQGMSKAILGGTLTTQADGKTSTNALGTIHNEVRRDLLAADAMQLAATLTSRLLAPLCLLNLGITDRKLLPYWRFDTQEAGDLSLYADALPKLAPYMRISRQFVHERLKLPVALDEDDVFRAEGQDGDGGDDRPDGNRPGRQKTTTRLTAPARTAPVEDDAKEDDTGDDGAGRSGRHVPQRGRRSGRGRRCPAGAAFCRGGRRPSPGRAGKTAGGPVPRYGRHTADGHPVPPAVRGTTGRTQP